MQINNTLQALLEITKAEREVWKKRPPAPPLKPVRFEYKPIVIKGNGFGYRPQTVRYESRYKGEALHSSELVEVKPGSFLIFMKKLLSKISS